MIVNELNKTIINIHKLIKEKPNQLIDAFSNLIKTKVVSKFGRIFLEKEEYEILASELKEEVHNLEKNNERGVETAIRFILLQCIQYSSNYTPKVTFEVSNFSNKIYSSEKIVEVISSFSNRIKKYILFTISSTLNSNVKMHGKYYNNIKKIKISYLTLILFMLLKITLLLKTFLLIILKNYNLKIFH